MGYKVVSGNSHETRNLNHFVMYRKCFNRMPNINYKSQYAKKQTKNNNKNKTKQVGCRHGIHDLK